MNAASKDHGGDHGEIITFYSYKGGSGRSMALANIACLLAGMEPSPGRKQVLAIDWDLEAPGLQRFFQPYLSRPEAEVDAQSGLIDFFIELAERTTALPSSLDAPSDTSWANGFDFQSYVMPTGIPGLDLMKAGRFGPDYTKNITSFDWAGLYARAPWLFSWFTNALTDQYRFVLIDSRTGETDTSSICTSILPETLVAVLTPNAQAIQGVLRQVERAVRFRRTAADERPIKILPVPSRIENARTSLRDYWRFDSAVGYQPKFEQLFRDLFGLKSCDLTSYFAKIQIPQSPDYAYGEPIAVREEATHDRFSLSGSYVDLQASLLDQSEIWEPSSESAQQIAERAIHFAKREAFLAPATPSGVLPDAREVASQLETALSALDWREAAAVCDAAIDRILRTGALLPVPAAEQILSMLRRARRFELARRLGDALIQTGESSNRIQRAYARSLLESGAIAAAIPLLEKLLEDPASDVEASADTYGLLGSAYKRMYVSLSRAPVERRRPYLIRSLDNYTKARSLSTGGSELFGINVVALLMRAEQDRVAVSGFEDPRSLAAAILDSISTPSRKMTWEYPIGMQAAIALGDPAEAARWLTLFLGSDAAGNPDAVGSLLDQLVNIWCLSETVAPGDVLLPALRAQLLKLPGGSVNFSESEVTSVSAIHENAVDLELLAQGSLPDTLAWFQTGTLRARNVARIENTAGFTIGTGFLLSVPGLSIDPNRLLLTAGHVVSAEGEAAGSSDPGYVTVNFTLLKWKTRPLRVIASSPVDQLDYTLLELEDSAKGVQPYPVSAGLPPAESGAHVYLAGHLGGGELKLGLNDNRLLGYNDRVVHYRSATGPGSSGSPVFNERWKLIAMHHASRADMPRLFGTGSYAANEGIRLKPILASILAQVSSQ